MALLHRSISLVDGEDLDIDPNELAIPGFPNPVNLQLTNPYEDMS